MYSYEPPYMAEQKQDDQLEQTYSSYMRIWDIALKTCQRWWTIGRSGEIGSGISVLVAWHNDDDFFFFFYHTCESMCDTQASSAANQGDNTVSVAQGGKPDS